MSVDSSDEGRLWIGSGTWLINRHAAGPSVGVVTDVREPDRGTSARLSIYWRPNRYQGISVSMALEKLIRGEWEVDR
ncbi:hypothetical protein [Haloplanus natans]|uniref:hypothetical protein n=1 Tax=Haloplanus natans TaxID=376171 RepID=UPI000677D846|nr:hypothetical protein [Haloplanus natans]